jgi:hypothetical protein
LISPQGRQREGFAVRRDGACKGSGIVRLLRSGRLPALIALASSLCACASISENMSGKLSDLPGIGMPAGVPERPVTPVSYPAVHDMPPQRGTALLNGVEQQKVENDLVGARDHLQAQAGIARPAAPVRKRAVPATEPAPRVIPVPSNRTIY